ncbi:MAG: RNA-binding cell elongation regulator Jag/EloR [Ferrimicrobium sp.]|jgi:spoIIIJ-associated protein|uniref:RNA-binding protein KhpB n=1 Tax=Ferrimicrobium acidiphilum TaxID=121039 RepID=A0ABV3Y623_9ACTN|nr:MULTISPECIES: RNA-binding cell elongation regulator Jag/EloR [Ferrimicrobium]
MEWIETTGKDLDEAKELALEHLGVEESEIEFEVLDEGRSSFLGFGRKSARIRARLRPSFPNPKRERKPRRPRSSTPETSNDKVEKPRTERVRSEKPKEPKKVESEENTTPRVEHSEVSRVELANAAQEFLAGLMHEFGLSGEVTVTHLDDESMELEINGEGLGSLVGPRGSVLAAVQEVTRSVVQTRAGEGAGRVSVDIAGYRMKRRAALEKFAREQADKVRETGEELVFEAMTAPDRKIIHDTVAEIEGVSTRSEGEEPNRYVVMFKESTPFEEANSDGETARVDS